MVFSNLWNCIATPQEEFKTYGDYVCLYSCWCIRLSTSSCIESCIENVRSGHVVRENTL
ncbi:hypothetical protein Hanom_Chr14g01262941 [Helianthus anomalus]